MSIPCLPTETSYDVQCPVCGRGFLLLFEPTATQRGGLHSAAQQALAVQHRGATSGYAAHPNEVFNLPAWDGGAEQTSAQQRAPRVWYADRAKQERRAA